MVGLVFGGLIAWLLVFWRIDRVGSNPYSVIHSYRALVATLILLLAGITVKAVKYREELRGQIQVNRSCHAK